GRFTASRERERPPRIDRRLTPYGPRMSIEIRAEMRLGARDREQSDVATEDPSSLDPPQTDGRRRNALRPRRARPAACPRAAPPPPAAAAAALEAPPDSRGGGALLRGRGADRRGRQRTRRPARTVCSGRAERPAARAAPGAGARSRPSPAGPAGPGAEAARRPPPRGRPA